MNSHLLSLAIWVPIIGALPVLALGSERRNLVRWLSLAVAIAGFVVTLPLYTDFDRSYVGMQFLEAVPWIPRFNIEYLLGVDGISVLFILLNAFVTILVILAGWEVIQEKVAQYMAAFLVMSGLMNGIFASLDAVLFYVFFEASLIPMYIIIGIWGGPNRVYAAFKFFLYTLLGSLLMLVALFYLFLMAGGSFNLLEWHQLRLELTPQILVFVAFLVAFAVKVPMWPVHTWLPDAHVEAPTGGSVVLAAIMLKLGAYGFLRFSLPILPDASHTLAPMMITLSLIAVVYIGFVALVQADMKKLIAYSSISHMGFVTLGFFIFNQMGVEGALVQMISHGFVSAAMFLCVGVMYDRMHSRQIADYGGVVNSMPKFAAFFMLFSMANSGLPATSGFVGEFMVILGAVKFNFWVGFAAATTLILGAAYTLWMYKRVVFGAVANDHVAELTDINGREFLILALLAAAVLAMGLYPFNFTDIMHASVDNLLKHVAVSKLGRARATMLNNFVMPDLYPAAPELFMATMACVILMLDALIGKSARGLTGTLTLLTLIGCAALTYVNLGDSASLTFSNMFVDDPVGDTLKLMVYMAVFTVVIYGRDYLAARHLDTGEYYVLVLFATLGMMVLISAFNFVTVYLGLELLSLSLYALVAVDRDSPRATEAAMKYFVLGALASGLLLYGMSMIYGATGTLEIGMIGQAMRDGTANPFILMFGLVFVVAGIGFKLGVVPFHMWVPDVYHGAPTAVTLFIASAPKLAAFAMALRLLVSGLFGLVEHWQTMLMIMAILSIGIGNLAAIAQKNIKRMLAYSGISHMGFMLLALMSGVAGKDYDPMALVNAYSSAMYYSVAYVIMSLGAFGIVLLLSRAGYEAENLEDFKGLNKRSPWFAAMMLVIMLSMAGIPFFVGFFAKFSVLLAAVAAGHLTAVVVAVMFSLIGAYYYLRVVKLMYFDAPVDSAPIRASIEMRVLLSANGIAVALLGLFPNALVSFCTATLLHML